MILAFDVLAMTVITPRLGVKLCQRIGSIVEVPVYFLVPVLSLVNAAGLPVTAFSVFLLFEALVGTNTVCMLRSHLFFCFVQRPNVFAAIPILYLLSLEWKKGRISTSTESRRSLLASK